MLPYAKETTTQTTTVSRENLWQCQMQRGANRPTLQRRRKDPRRYETICRHGPAGAAADRQPVEAMRSCPRPDPRTRTAGATPPVALIGIGTRNASPRPLLDDALLRPSDQSNRSPRMQGGKARRGGAKSGQTAAERAKGTKGTNFSLLLYISLFCIFFST